MKNWIEVKKGKEDFQKILKILIDFDEKTGRHVREDHYFRKAISVCDISNLRIFMKETEKAFFSIVVELRSNGICVTSWLHEDGIALEREQFAADKRHPVHTIVCMTDIHRKNPGPVSKKNLHLVTMELLK